MFLRRRRHELPGSEVRGSGPARSRPCHGQCRHAVRAQGGSMNEELLLFNMLDMAGTFAFAISGAVAARQKNLDLFGIIAIAYMVACGGGIIRDVCIGAIPPAGLADWRYLALALVASALALVAYPLLQRLDHPVQMFAELGLRFLAVSGAHPALAFGHNAQVAVLLGLASAVGGGATRDVLPNRTTLSLPQELTTPAAQPP